MNMMNDDRSYKTFVFDRETRETIRVHAWPISVDAAICIGQKAIADGYAAKVVQVTPWQCPVTIWSKYC